MVRSLLCCLSVNWRRRVGRRVGNNMEKHKRKILLVEDDPDTSLPLAMLLELEGFDVRVASNGQQAIDSSPSDRPDLVVTDICMPLMSGFDLISQFQDDPELADIPIVAVSAVGKNQLQRALQLGAVAAYQKPIEYEQFLSSIGGMLSSRKRGHARYRSAQLTRQSDDAMGHQVRH
jgi:CheY-like chemotaxis protein